MFPRMWSILLAMFAFVSCFAVVSRLASSTQFAAVFGSSSPAIVVFLLLLLLLLLLLFAIDGFFVH